MKLAANADESGHMGDRSIVFSIQRFSLRVQITPPHDSSFLLSAETVIKIASGLGHLSSIQGKNIDGLDGIKGRAGWSRLLIFHFGNNPINIPI